MPDETIGRLLNSDASGILGKSDSIGLNNIHSRVKLLFGEPFGLNIESGHGEGSRVTLCVPLGEKEGSHG